MTALLEAEDVSYAYGRLRALSGVSFQLAPGEIVGILGPNGSGKSTLLALLAGLLQPDHGAVRVGGELMTEGRADLRARVGYCPQRPTLWPDLTAREQLAFMAGCQGRGRRAAAHQARTLLEVFGLESKGDVRARRLSGGMQQRLSVALALVQDPPIVLLDEPEAGMDTASLRLVDRHLRALARDRGTLVVFSTHDRESALTLATRVAVLEDGQLVGMGPSVDVLARAPRRAAEASP